MEDGLQVGPFSRLYDTVARATGYRSSDPAKITIQINFSTVVENWKLEVSPEDTIADVKQQIFEKYKIPSGDQILSAGTTTVIKILKDDEKIKDAYIKQDDILKLKLREKMYPWTIYIKYNTGDPVPVGVSPEDTLDMIRARIFDQHLVLWDEKNNEYFYNRALNTMKIQDGHILYAQDEKAKMDIPTQENAVQRREANVDQEQVKRPATPVQIRSRPRSRNTEEIEREDESDDENAQLQDLHDTLKRDVPPAAGGAHREPANVPGNVEDDTGRSTISNKTGRSKAEEQIEDLEEKLEETNERFRTQRQQIQEQRKFVEGLCTKLNIGMNRESFMNDIEQNIDEIQKKLKKRDAFIRELDDVLQNNEIRIVGDEESHILALVKEVKTFSVEIGQILQVYGDVDMIAYKQKARDMIDNEARQKASITRLEADKARLTANSTGKHIQIPRRN
jgi:hypothetical protein